MRASDRDAPSELGAGAEASSDLRVLLALPD
jgi:hypothetical protein